MMTGAGYSNKNSLIECIRYWKKMKKKNLTLYDFFPKKDCIPNKWTNYYIFDTQ